MAGFAIPAPPPADRPRRAEVRDQKGAKLEQAKVDLARAEKIMKQTDIPFLDSTTKSIEEIATHMLHEAHLLRRVY